MNQQNGNGKSVNDNGTGEGTDLLVWRVVPWDLPKRPETETKGRKTMHELVGAFRKGIRHWRGSQVRETQVQVLESSESFLLKFDVAKNLGNSAELDQDSPQVLGQDLRQKLKVSLDGNELEVELPGSESGASESHLFILPSSVALTEIGARYLESGRQLELRLPKRGERKEIPVVYVSDDSEGVSEDHIPRSREYTDGEMANYTLATDGFFWSSLSRNTG